MLGDGVLGGGVVSSSVRVSVSTAVGEAQLAQLVGAEAESDELDDERDEEGEER